MKSMDYNSLAADRHSAIDADEEDRIEAIEKLAEELGKKVPGWMFNYGATEETLVAEAQRRIDGGANEV
jgi:uncharacterized protein with GYD domain